MSVSAAFNSAFRFRTIRLSDRVGLALAAVFLVKFILYSHN
jgi:hypothetical protein